MQAMGLVKHAWTKAILPLAGAALGAIAAPEGESAQGAALGGLGALGLQSTALGLKGTFPLKNKTALDLSGSMGIPGVAGVSLGLKDLRERLPGMSRWAPHDTVERGFDYADSNLDPQAVAGLEADRGTLTHPLLGAALAAAGARHFFPQSGTVGPALAGLVGAGAGSLYNQATRNRRVEEGLEAFQGAQRERERFPLQRHPVQTANEAPPLTVSSGNGEV